MPNFSPFLVPLIIFLFEFIFRKLFEKPEDKKQVVKDKTFLDKLFSEFDFDAEEEVIETKEIVEAKTVEVKKSDPISVRDQNILKQELKVKKHSELEGSNRLVRSDDLKRTSLILERASMVRDHLDYDLDKKSETTIIAGVDKKSKSFLGLEKDDLVKGLILSEILDKPKSLR